MSNYKKQVKSKISENFSFKKMEENIDNFSSMIKLYRILKLFGFNDSNFEESINQFSMIKKQLKRISESSDLFNKYFAERGWIAHENMNYTLMEECINLAQNNEIDAAELKLVTYYKTEDLSIHIGMLKSIPTFKIRYTYLLRANDDFRNERYYACIPILLMMIDGAVDDIKNENKGFFAEGADLSAWDSIAGHESGLKYVAALFGKPRKRTTEEKITLPYRNGILHGKDLGFDNELVAAKLWSTLFAVGAWARIIVEGKNVAPEEKERLSFKESLTEIKNIVGKYQHRQIEKAILYKAIEDWKPRIFENDSFENFELNDNTPEKELNIFFNNVCRKRFDLIANQLDSYSRANKTKGKLIGEVREKFESIEVSGYKIKSINDESPAISEILAAVTAQVNNKQMTKDIKFRMIYQNLQGDPQTRGNINGKWYLLNITLYDFYNFEWIK